MIRNAVRAPITNPMKKPVISTPSAGHLMADLVSCPRNKHIFRCDQNGPPARRSEPDWRWEGAYLNRYVTDEQRSRRPIFIATLWAAVSWPLFGVARSSRIDSDMLVARALKNSQLTRQPPGERHAYFGDRTLTVAAETLEVELL
jgi:hypothetical protein